MILIQYYAFVKYFNVPDQDLSNRSKSLNEKYQLPDVSIMIVMFIEFTFDKVVGAWGLGREGKSPY